MNTTVEELRRLAEIPPGTATARRQALFIAANEIETLQKQVTTLNVKVSDLKHQKFQLTNQILNLHAILARVHDTKNQLENALIVVLPMAKGYVFYHDVGNNKAMVLEAEETLAKARQELQP